MVQASANRFPLLFPLANKRINQTNRGAGAGGADPEVLNCLPHTLTSDWRERKREH